MRKQYRSPLLASIHETAGALHASGVMDKRILGEFDELCLTPARPPKPGKLKPTARKKPPTKPSPHAAAPIGHNSRRSVRDGERDD